MILLKCLLPEGLIKSQLLSKTAQMVSYKFNEQEISVEPLRSGNLRIGFNHPLTKELLDDLIKFLNNLGYIPSFYNHYISDAITKFDYNKVLKDINSKLQRIEEIIFQPKYSNVVNVKGKLLYHITSIALLDKIKKMGLIPRLEGKMTIRGSARIYFTFEPSEVIGFSKQLKAYFPKYQRKKDMMLLTIDPSKIPNAKFFRDTNFYDGESVYCTCNVPPSAIIKYENVDKENEI